MTTITIDKNIPIPGLIGGRRAVYPWDTLEVNESFFVADRTTKNFGSMVYSASKRTGRKFISRTVDGGVRVWRTA